MRRLCALLVLVVGATLEVSAQRVVVDNLASHVIVDACSGCGGGASAPTTASGTLSAATQSVDISTAGSGVVGIDISGVWTGTLFFRGKVAGTTSWFVVKVLDVEATITGGLVTQTTVNGALTFNATGFSNFQVYANVLSSGSASVSLTATSLAATQRNNVVITNAADGATASVLSGALRVSASIDAVTTGDPLQVYQTNGTQMHITCDSGCGSPPATADGTAFTAGVTNVSPIAALVDDVATTTVAEDAYGAPRMTPSRVLYADLSQTGANATAIKVDGSAVTQPVSGTFWQATQPVSGTFWQATQPVSGTFWQATQPVSSTQLPAALAANGGLKIEGVAGGVAVPVSGTFFQGTQPVSIAAHVTVDQGTPGGFAAPWQVKFSDGTTGIIFAAASTAVPASFASIPVGLSPNSPLPTGSNTIGALTANQSVNVAQLAGTATSVNSGVKDAGTLRVVIATDQPALTNKLLVTPDSVALPANQSVNVAQVGGTNTVNGGLAGTLAVGGTAANNAAITQNPIVGALEARSSTPTQATNGNQIRQAGDLAGNTFNVMPIAWSCNLAALAATLTQCQAAPSASYSLYLTAIIATTTTGTAGTFNIQRGTGTNCATTPTGVWPSPGTATPSRTVTAPLVTAAPMVINLGPVGIKVTAANAICVIGTATNTIDIVLSGYTAP